MVDEELLAARYQPEELRAIGDALLILHQFGVFPLQAHANSQRISEGFNSDQNPSELAAEILQVRQTNRQLLALHEMAGNFKKGLSNA